MTLRNGPQGRAADLSRGVDGVPQRTRGPHGANGFDNELGNGRLHRRVGVRCI
jgi:hypothetical protein